MYKVIIVDDEPLIRRGLRYKVDWNSLGFEIIGEASNGLDALNLLNSAGADVVITDMKMPVMDGIKMLESIKQASLMTRVIVVSAYSSFDYTHAAVKCSAFDYILKPIDGNELTEVLLRVKASIESEMGPQEMSKYPAGIRQPIPEIKDKFLKSFFSSQLISENNLESQLVDLNLSPDLKKYICLAIMIPELTSMVKETFNEDYDKAFACITRLIQNIALNKSFSVTTFRSNIYMYNFYVIIGFETEDSTTVDIIENLKNDLEAFLMNSIIIGVGKEINNLHEINTSFTQALDALCYRRIINESCIIFSDDLRRRNFTLINYSSENENAFLTSLEICNFEEMEHNIYQLFDCIRNVQDISFRQVYKLFSELLFLCDRVLRKYDINLEQIFKQDITSIDYIACKASLPQLEHWFSEIVFNIMHFIMDKKASNMSNVVDEIKSYIETHYFEDLSLNDLSQKFYINKSYLSALFKKRTGQTFIDFLTSVRMDKACELLAGNNRYKVYEIARLVGYTDKKYFSKLFKKLNGINPEEYKNNHSVL